jgi:hypothetical protein
MIPDATRIGAAVGVVLVLSCFGRAIHARAAQEPTPSRAPSADDVRQVERNVMIWISTIVSAQKAYAAANGGFFDEVKCLQQPSACIAGFPAEEAPFLDPGYDWLAPSLGYSRRFHAGPAPSADEIARKRASASSLKAFAFTAAPLVRGQPAGRGFCGDSGGRMCATPDGAEPPVKEGRCEPCRKLQ